MIPWDTGFGKALTRPVITVTKLFLIQSFIIINTIVYLSIEINLISNFPISGVWHRHNINSFSLQLSVAKAILYGDLEDLKDILTDPTMDVKVIQCIF